MEKSYRFEPLFEIKPETKLLEIQNEILQSFDFLMKHLDRLVSYLKKENELKNYIEIDLPVLDLSISYN